MTNRTNEEREIERVVKYIHDNLEGYEIELIRAEVSKGLAEHLSERTFVTHLSKVIELAEEYMEEQGYDYDEFWWQDDALDDLLLQI